MTQQVTAGVDDDTNAWLDQMSEDLGVSKADVIRRCIHAIRAHDDPHAVLEPYRNTTATVFDVRQDVRALEARVSTLEAEVTDTPDTEAAQRAAARPDEAENITAEWVADTADWTVAESAETDAKNQALADAYEQLRDAGSMTTPELVDVYHDYDLSVAESTFRREVLSVLNTLPHVTKPGSGQSTWHYTGDE